MVRSLVFQIAVAAAILVPLAAPGRLYAQDTAEPELPSAAVLAEYRKPGTGHIHGAFTAAPKGHEEIAQTEIDRPVYLLPDIPYSRWLLGEFKRRSEYHVKYPNTHMRTLEISPEVKALIRSVKTDESGEYEFEQLPYGKYLLFLDGQIDVPRDLDHLSDPTHPWAVWVRDAYHATYVSDPIEIGPHDVSFFTHLYYYELLRAAGVH